MKAVKWISGCVAAVSALLLVQRGVVGPSSIVNNPLGVETACGVAAVIALVFCSRAQSNVAASQLHHWPVALFVIVAAILAFLPILSMPLITDDYIHLRQISKHEAPTPLGCLTHSCGGPQFFRPLGFATYWAEWEAWGNAALPRHAFDLILHAFSSVLFLLLVQRLGVGPPLDLLAALVFAWGGIRAEAVAWPAARFDTLAVLFSLVAGLAALRGGSVGLIGSMFATFAACLSKESAYVLPVLLALLMGSRLRTRAGRLLIVANTAVAVAIFAWRWFVLRGIGGYLQADGSSPSVLQLNPGVLAKTFLARIWAILWFPINWSRPLEWWMILGLAAGVLGVLLLLRSRAPRAVLLLCLLGVVVACLPAHQMLLIGPSLERSRYLDLASLAFTLFLAFACTALPRHLGPIVLAAVAIFQLASLEHNLRIWSSVSNARYELCRNLSARARASAAPITIENIPTLMDGIYWRNGIEDCLWLDFGVPMGQVQVNPSGSGQQTLPEGRSK